MFTALKVLLSPQVSSARHLLKRSMRRWESLFFFLLGLLCLWGCYRAGIFVFGQLLKVEVIADLLMIKTMGFVLTFFTYILLFSTLLSIFAHHYLAADLALLISAPTSIPNLFLARSLSAWAQNSWMVFVFAWPTLAAGGYLMSASLSYYLILSYTLLCLTLWCTGIAAVIGMLLARMFPARRLQEALVVLVVVAFIYVYVQFNASRPDRFFREDGFKDLIALIEGLRHVGSESGVVGWSVRALFSTLPVKESSIVSAQLSREITLPLLYLTLSVSALWAGACLLASKIYLGGYWLCQEGIGKAGESKVARAKPAYAKTTLHAMSRRDWQIFWRSPSQWTQLLLIGSLGVVYVYNFKYFDALHETGFFNTASLFVTHIALTGMVMITLAARFLYPSICAEGKAIWVLQSAPITPKQLLRSKVRWALLPLLCLSGTLSALCVWLTDLSTPWLIATLWSGWLLTLVVLGLSVGMGAIKPRFNLANPQVAAAGLGGISFMLFALLCTGLLVAMTFPSAMGLMSLEIHLNQGLSWKVGIQSAYDLYGVWPFVGWIGANLFAFLTYKIALSTGARHLEIALTHDVHVEG